MLTDAHLDAVAALVKRRNEVSLLGARAGVMSGIGVGDVVDVDLGATSIGFDSDVHFGGGT